ncbi:MAG: hypothetical protein KME17_08235 [Cyanosarcina radialis HA8281-LM2]|jgi:hypothetical protein|nr:hypothetical protein [Cyanosarcina radialis HA8281-LM2]
MSKIVDHVVPLNYFMYQGDAWQKLRSVDLTGYIPCRNIRTGKMQDLRYDTPVIA